MTLFGKFVFGGIFIICLFLGSVFFSRRIQEDNSYSDTNAVISTQEFSTTTDSTTQNSSSTIDIEENGKSDGVSTENSGTSTVATSSKVLNE
jgi:hypothetical protein